MAKEEEVEEGAPLWVLTFGDMMSLLLTFFILLFSMSTIEQKKFSEVLGAIQTVLGAGASVQEPVEDVTPKEVVRKLRAIAGEGISGAEQIAAEGHQIRIQTVREGLKITFGGRPLFEEGRADILPGAHKILDKLAGLIRGYRNKVRIMGHTSGAPGDTFPPPQGKWGLGFARAMAVRRFLEDRGGIQPARLEAGSAAQYQPLRAEDEPVSDAPDGKGKDKKADKDEPGAEKKMSAAAENRRVELIVTEELIPWSRLN